MNLIHVDIEMDSLVLVNIVQSKVNTPWVIRYEIRNILSLLGAMDYTIGHVYRECNAAADWLVNFGVKIQSRIHFDSDVIPARLRGIVRIDRSGLPCIRRKSQFVSSSSILIEYSIYF